MGMPVLFPLCALNFLNQWICERVVIAKFMQLPPALDDTLMKNVVIKLKWAPLLFIVNGYWMISNK